VNASAADTALIVHATSVHPRDDARIRYRYCEAAQQRGWDVGLVAPRPATAGDDTRFLLDVDTVEKPGLLGRIERIVRTARTTIRARPAIAHVHDPELLLIAPVLKLFGISVVYDVHEDVLKQIDLKEWLPKPVRHTAQLVVRSLYRWIHFLVDGVVVADPAFVAEFPRVPTAVQRNYPRRSELASDLSKQEARRRLGLRADGAIVVAIGSISPSRRPELLVEAIRPLAQDGDLTLVFAGREQPTDFLTEYVSTTAGDEFTSLIGHVDRDDVSALLVAADVGLCVLPATPTYSTALPTKLVEYASAGLPTVVSDFPVCRRFLDEHGSGICVDPDDEAAIRDATVELLDSDERLVRPVPSWEADFDGVERLYAAIID
jgi:glycosyltransferase involved in cell wall biosynthesis